MWVVVGVVDIYFDNHANPATVFKLTPQMLQRLVHPQMQWGYFGKQPFRDMPPMIELVTDLETCWELDKLGGQQGVGGVPSISGNWRFEQWDAANKYWKLISAATSATMSSVAGPVPTAIQLRGHRGKQVPVIKVDFAVCEAVPSSGAGGAA